MKNKRHPFSFTAKEVGSLEALLDSVEALVSYSEGTSTYRHDCKRVSNALRRNYRRIQKTKGSKR